MPALHVSINGNEAPVRISLPHGAKVSHLCSAVLAQANLSNASKQVRVIAHGKLVGNERLLSSPSIKSCGLVHCAIATPSPSVERSSRISESFTQIDIGEIVEEVRDEVTRRVDRMEWLGGFTTGLLMGFIVVVIVMDGSIGVSRRWRGGVTCGVAINIVFGMVLLLTTGM